MSGKRGDGTVSELEAKGFTVREVGGTWFVHVPGRRRAVFATRERPMLVEWARLVRPAGELFTGEMK